MLTACDKFLLTHPDSVPHAIGPVVKLLRDCGLSTPRLTLHKTNVIHSPNAAVCLLVALHATMQRLNG
ncbi:unnamed protein product [Strongylus vulgaris]|uniref:Uncharacterized protein n=1 Tax=Strongylus vulgaris TaxID=40348 RepID=A0A3P7J4J1_STRVU|nr:unnamed protein product [Strongylus vulgaris]